MTGVVQLQYSSSSAGKSAVRLQEGLIEAGINSTIISLYGDGRNGDRIVKVGRVPRMKARLDQKLQEYRSRNHLPGYGMFSYPVLGTDVGSLKEVKEADVIYIHWVLYGFMNLRSFRKLARLRKPMIVVMHDMWPITGGCHHSFDCMKYRDGCGECQVFPYQKNNDLSAKGFRKKKRLYDDLDQLHFVSPSRWLFESAKQSLLTRNKPIHYIPNVMDQGLYVAGDKDDAREKLGIGADRVVIGFGAYSISSPYKGWSYFLESLRILKNDYSGPDILVIAFGSEYDTEMAKSIPFETRFTGYIGSEDKMAGLYNAMDVFVAPSLADNQPTTVMESLSCGTPVVGFRVGGIPDMIDHLENGYLAEYRNPEDMAKGISVVLERKIRGSRLPGFEKEVVINQHIELLKSLTIHQSID